MTPEIHIDLRDPPADRWHLSPQQLSQARQLLKSYLTDLGGMEQFGDMLTAYAEMFVPDVYLAEIKSLASAVGCTMEEALLVNLYYDAVKMVLGCTAFAVDTPQGPLHARNLDWWTENAMLSDYTSLTHFRYGANGHAYTTVGWPGYVGALSGIAPGRFAITLNAVLSDEPPALAIPVSLFLRTVLEEAATYDEAVEWLMSEAIASDCLLLITGTLPGQMAVIERTPNRATMRKPESGFIAVANAYIALDHSQQNDANTLQATSEGRFCAVKEILERKRPSTTDACFAILSNPSIQMKITVQQMVFCAATGEIQVRLPEG